MLHSRRRFHANAPGTTPRFPIPPSAAELSDRGSDGIPLELAQKDRQSSACQSLSAWPRDQQEIWADSAFEPLVDVTAGRFDLDFEWQRSCSLNVQVSFNSNHERHEVTPKKILCFKPHSSAFVPFVVQESSINQLNGLLLPPQTSHNRQPRAANSARPDSSI